jgi:hypothetical protein
MKKRNVFLAGLMAGSFGLISLTSLVFAASGMAVDSKTPAKTATTTAVAPATALPTSIIVPAATTPEALQVPVSATIAPPAAPVAVSTIVLSPAPAAAAVTAPAAIVPVIVLTAADYLDIQTKPGDAKHKFQQYSLALHNKQPKHIQVLQFEVTNGLSEQDYVQYQQQKSQNKMRLAGGVLRGLTSVATSFVPYAGLGSMAAYQAIGAGSMAVNGAANMMQNSQGGGGTDYAGHIVQRANDIMISPNQDFQFLVVVPQNQQPAVKIIFKDLQSNQIYDLQK